MKRFPRLSETFILNEILELERQGHRIEVFSLLRPPPEGRHALLSELKARVTYLPSASSTRKLPLHESLEELPTDLAAAATQSGPHPDPLFNGKSRDDIAAMYVKAAALALLAEQRGIKHLHAHFASDSTTVALLASRLSGVPFSFTAHARDIYHTYTNAISDNAMRRAKIREAAFTVTVSDYNRSYLCRLAPAHAARIQRLYNGIDLTRFTPKPSASASGLVVAVGRLVEKKGFRDLISACALMRRSNTSFRCRIIGNGPLQDSLMQQIVELELTGYVEIVGPMPQEVLIGSIREASLAVLPCIVSQSGDRDGLPTVLLEAMALGLPAVTTTVSGGPEIVAHGETGLLVEPGDPAALAASIESLLASPASMARMGRAARQRAETLFSLRECVAELASYFAKAARSESAILLEAV